MHFNFYTLCPKKQSYLKNKKVDVFWDSVYVIRWSTELYVPGATRP